MDSQENFPIQGNDTRKNIDKPRTTWQRAYDVLLSDGSTMRALEVHVNDDPSSPVYFNGDPNLYKGGAVYHEELENDAIDTVNI